MLRLIDLEILLYAAVSPAPYKSPSMVHAETVRELMREPYSLIQPRESDGWEDGADGIELTERGHAWFDEVLSTPLPTRRIVWDFHRECNCAKEDEE